MGLSNAERQARWRAKRNAEIKRLRKVTAALDAAKPVVRRGLLKPRDKK
jgi:hypothetical protein